MKKKVLVPTSIKRIVVAPKTGTTNVYKIYYLEVLGAQSSVNLDGLFCNAETEKIISELPAGDFLEVMYHNGVIDPAQESIITACAACGVKVVAVKVSQRYYGKAREGVFVNKLVHIAFTDEPVLTTLMPRGSRQGMKTFNLLAMGDEQLVKLSESMSLSLSLDQMKGLVKIQTELKVPVVTDVFLETFAARWSDHCCHTKWKALGLFDILRAATERITNPNLVSAFVDNAGAVRFFDGLVALFKLETHNSPSQNEPYGGQLTKFGGVIRDIFGLGLGALPCMNLELTTVGQFALTRYPGLSGRTLPARTIARETIRAVKDYGNPMGIPMGIARMNSHPDFGGKVFALGGTVGITTEEAAKKGCSQQGDLVVLVGGRTGNDGLHGATVSSGEMTQEVDAGDACHVQIGNPFTEQKFMRAVIEIRDAKCASAVNDFGAAGIVSAVGEMGELVGDSSGVLVNLAAVLRKAAGLENWQIALSESQERMAFAIKPNKLRKAMQIFRKYELEATVIGVFTGNGRFQMIFDKSVKKFTADMLLSGEIALDVPYACFDGCPLPRIEVIEPPPKAEIHFPEINLENVEEMLMRLLGNFDVCNQSLAVRQYDSTVQGRTWQGPLYGVNYNVSSHLAVSQPVYGKPYGITISQSFHPGQFEVDPVIAALNAMIDAIVTQMLAGVHLRDVALADNFYTPNKDPYAYWYLREQVIAIAGLSELLGTPFITGKDSSSGSATFADIGLTISVPPSVAITAMGKVPDVNKIVPQQWQKNGNVIFVLGPMCGRLDGSVLASSLGIVGAKLDVMPVGEVREYMEGLSDLARSGIIKSAVPINRGGIALRMFEGIEASGFGLQADVDVPLEMLFREMFGSVLVEVDDAGVDRLYKQFNHKTGPVYVGTILPEKKMQIQRMALSWEKLHSAWNGTFAKEVM